MPSHDFQQTPLLTDLDDRLNQIRNLDLSKVTAYVEATGWKFRHRLRNGIAIYRKKRNGTSFQLAIVPDREFDDFDEAMEKVVKTLAECERRSESLVIQDLLNQRSGSKQKRPQILSDFKSNHSHLNESGILADV